MEQSHRFLSRVFGARLPSGGQEIRSTIQTVAKRTRLAVSPLGGLLVGALLLLPFPASSAVLGLQLFDESHSIPNTLYSGPGVLNDCIHGTLPCSNNWDGSLVTDSAITSAWNPDNGTVQASGITSAVGTYGHLSSSGVASMSANPGQHASARAGGTITFNDLLTITSSSLAPGTLVDILYTVVLDQDIGLNGAGSAGSLARFGPPSCCWIAPVSSTGSNSLMGYGAARVGGTLSISGVLDWGSAGNLPWGAGGTIDASVSSAADYFVEVLTPGAGYISESGFDYGGRTQSTPILPDSTLADGTFVFTGVSTNRWFDPARAYGYHYEMTSDSLFTNILGLPTGFASPFTIRVAGCSIPGTYGSSMSVDFVSLCGAGVSSFDILGIDPLVDASDPLAFPVQLAFSTPSADFTMTPLDAPIGGGTAPEPATFTLLAVGLAGLGLRRRRKPN